MAKQKTQNIVARKAAAKHQREASAPKPAKKKAAKANYADYHLNSPVWDKVDDDLKARIGKLRKDKKLTERAVIIAQRLEKEFPNAECALHHKSPLQLLLATILSAQCTDERVNQVTPGLFKKYPTAEDFMHAPAGELENDIKPTGFFNNKAKSLRAACRDIVEKHGGKVPESMEELVALHGVARKTASVVRTNCFDYPGLTVDTHFLRVTKRLGLTKNTDQEKVEADVANVLPPEHWDHFTHAIILHGRKTCKARKPLCGECPVADLCPSAFKV